MNPRIIFAFLFLSTFAFAHPHGHLDSSDESLNKARDESIQLDDVVISDSYKEGPLTYTEGQEVEKIEVITKRKIEAKQAKTLADAVANEVGLDAQTSCANCGARRVTINGMKGEYTTILVDDVPLHSSVSSFYGLDAIPAVSIEALEIARGAGNALTTPEAMGGAVNIITPRARETHLTLIPMLGTASTQMFSILGTAVGDGGKNRAVIAGQYSHQGFWDVDRNLVSEAPDLKNKSVLIKLSRDFSDKDTLELRFAKQNLNILGGNTNGVEPTTYVRSDPAQPFPPFQNNDVSQLYLGSQDLVTDLIQVNRTEVVGRWNRLMNENWSMRLTSSYAVQNQDNLYMHGYDYNNSDQLTFNELKSTLTLGSSHIFTQGLEYRFETMSSNSQALYINRVPPLPKDNFDFQSRALYLQDLWLISPDFELLSVLRIDSLSIHWVALGSELRNTVVAPRLSLKWHHSSEFTSRFAYGLGYRAPISFFETQHGLSESGFKMNLTEIEKANFLGYSLNFQTPRWAASGSVNYNAVSNIAYAQEADNHHDPAVFRNYQNTLGLWAFDVGAAHDLTRDLNVQVTYEKYLLPNAYKNLLPIATIEDRIRFISDYHFLGLELISTLNWIGPRDLTPYHGYGSQYKNLVTRTSPDTGLPETVGGDLKWQRAPSFFTLDLYLSREFSKTFSAFASITNLLDYTQTGAGDSPLNWTQHGSDQDHLHLDNNHVWGPLRGRIFTAGVKIIL
jgi:outer membrane cobalamin receptor